VNAGADSQTVSPKVSNIARQINQTSDKDLLAQLIGVRETGRWYRGTLTPFFSETSPAEVATKCLAARELVKRWLAEQLHCRPVFATPDSVKDYLRLHFAGREYESFVVLYLDAQNCLIDVEELFRGTLTQTSVYPREVVKSALRHNAAAVMLSHNHPSGAVAPSRADEHLTQTLKAALTLVDVRVLDHLIIAGNLSLSFAERGLI